MLKASSNLPLLNWLDSNWFNGWWIIFWLILFSCLVGYAAKLLSDTVESWTNRSKVSKVFLGGVVMSFLTSIPELMASIYGSFEQENTVPLFSIYNESGSSVLQVFMISLVLLVFFSINYFKNKNVQKTKTISEIYEKSIHSLDKQNYWLLVMLLGYYFLLTLQVLNPKIGEYLYVHGWNISIISIVPMILYLSFVLWTLLKKNKSTEITQPGRFDKLNKHWLFILTFVLGVALAWLAYANSAVCDKMAEQYHIPEQSAASIILSIPSALPEVLTMIFMFRKKQYTLGFSTIIGSGLTNSSFIFYVDSIYRKPIFKTYFEDWINSTNYQIHMSASRLQYWVPLILLIYIILFGCAHKKLTKNNTYMTIGLSSICVCYILGVALISSLVF